MTRLEWARALMRRWPDGPVYGSPEWLALADGPAKVAAVVRAAELWVRDGDEFAERLQAETDAAQAAYLAGFLDGENNDYRSRRDAHRAAWNGKVGTFRPDRDLSARLEAEWRAWVGDAS